MTGVPTNPIFETRHAGGFIVWDPSDGISTRDQITLASGFGLLISGTVLGRQTVGTSATASALGTNTGNGTVGAITVTAKPTQIGTYAVAFTAPTAFTVTAPNGQTATGTTGTAFAALGIGFTITAGGTAFVAGDGFGIVTAATAGNPSTTVTANAGNTGNGTVGTVTTAAAPQLGNYIVEFDTATTFIVSAPSGPEIGHGATGAAFSGGGLSFTITAGGTAFVGGDSIQITVASGAGNYAPFDPSQSDGTEIAAGILISGYAPLIDTSIGVSKASALVRGPASVNQAELIWGNTAGNVTQAVGQTLVYVGAAQQAAALAQLQALGIVARQGQPLAPY